jgi:hypothetical protein
MFGVDASGNTYAGAETNDAFGLVTNGTYRMYITAGGSVGVGTTTVDERLHVSGGNIKQQLAAATNGGFNVNNGTNDLIAIGTGGFAANGGSVTDGGIRTTNSLVFATGSGAPERARIDSSGRLGLGTSSPGRRLVIAGDTNTVCAIQGANNGTSSLFLGDTDAESIGAFTYNHVGNHLEVTVNAAERMRIDSSGRVGIGTTAPLSRLHVNTGTNENIRLNSSELSAGGPQIGAINDASNAYVNLTLNGSNILFGNGSSERGRWDSSGRLLVGTSTYSGNSAFVIKGGAAQNVGLVDVRFGGSRPTGADVQLSEIRFGSTDFTSNSAYANIQCITDGASSSDADIPGRLVFSTTADGASSPTERMRITNSGLVGIGDTSGATRLVVKGEETLSLFTNLTATTSTFRTTIGFADGFGTQRGTIATSTTGTQYNTSSDYRLKENVVPLTGAADRLKQLSVHRFNFVNAPEKTVDGFLAHEAQAVVPECVSGTKDEVDEDGNPVYQGIDQSKLVPLLTAALQEALAEIESLKARVTALEA